MIRMLKARMDSIPESDVTSELVKTVLCVTAMLFLASCVTTGDKSALSIGAWVSSPKSSLKVDGRIAGICEEALGYKYPENEIEYCEGKSSRIWAVATKGKHGLITTLFEIKAGKIVGSEVLESREQWGKQVESDLFLRQFAGASLAKDSKLSNRVEAVTGATISSRAVIGAAELALRLDAEHP